MHLFVFLVVRFNKECYLKLLLPQAGSFTTRERDGSSQITSSLLVILFVKLKWLKINKFYLYLCKFIAINGSSGTC